jgi:hypothetical protein
LQLFPDAVAVLNMLHLEFVEVVQKPPGFRGVVATAGKVLNYIFLLRNVSLAFGNMPLSFFQMTDLHRSIHDAG